MEEYPALKIGDRVICGPDYPTEYIHDKIGTVTRTFSSRPYWVNVCWDEDSFIWTFRYFENTREIKLYIKPEPINHNPKPFFNFNFDLISI